MRRSGYPLARLGIIGGGQLGRMMTLQAKKLGCHVFVLDPYPHSPAGAIAMEQVVGGFGDPQAIRTLVERCDVTTYDIEHINTRALQELEAEGHVILPAPGLLAMVQDKLRQKEALAAQGIPVVPYEQCDHPTPEALAAFGYPLVQKLRHGGYDGKGVALLRGPEDLRQKLPGESLLERVIDIAEELSVMVVRGRDTHMVVYPAVEMVFDPRGNLLDLLLAPARIPEALARQAREMAEAAISAVDGVGAFGVEMFHTANGQLLINEIAPRPHNSGHYTIEACMTSQFEQHVRAVLGLPLGSAAQISPCAMINLLGEPGSKGKPHLEGLDEALAIPGVSVHIYGKAEVRPLRKMGHVTVLDDSVEAAAEKAKRVRACLRIVGEFSG
jgi:5-(carboxyamino)imidazole ribonucleotide synthase